MRAVLGVSMLIISMYCEGMRCKNRYIWAVKKFATIFFVLFYLWYQMGFFVHFQIERQAIAHSLKKHLKKSILSNDRIRLDFTTEELSELTWHKSHEFEWKGQFYDVLQRKAKEGISTFYCISDTQETALFEQLNEYVAYNQGDESSESGSKTHMKQLQSPIVFLPNSLYPNPNDHFLEEKKDNFRYLDQLSSGFDRERVQPPC